MDSAAPASGRATAAGTRRFAERFSGRPGHFRRPDEAWLSSLALGTRNGDASRTDDALYRAAVPRCLEAGVNLFATALSDRMQRSERTLGVALQQAFREGRAARDELVVATRGGFLTPDPDLVRTAGQARRYLFETYVETGLAGPESIAGGVLCLEPAFLRDQIQRSRRNLRLETIDLYLLEQPELLLDHAGPSGFRRAICAAFEALEAAVQEGQIAAYGLATWDGLLRPHSDRYHLSVLDLFDWALEVGGADHHLRAVQLPYNLAMAEALQLPTQLVRPGGGDAILKALRGTGTAVLASAPLVQGRALGRLPEFVQEAFPELRSDAQCCLQFARSTPGVTSAVVGMRQPEHLAENLEVAARPPADPAVIEALFQRAGGSGDERAA